MAINEPELIQKLLTIISSSPALNDSDFPKPDPSYIDDILKQRRDQRDKILGFSIKLSYISIALICVISFCQIIFRFIHPTSNESIFPDGQFQVLSAAVFGQIISVIVLITKSLWQDDTYMPIISKDYEKSFVSTDQKTPKK